MNKSHRSNMRTKHGVGKLTTVLIACLVALCAHESEANQLSKALPYGTESFPTFDWLQDCSTMPNGKCHIFNYQEDLKTETQVVPPIYPWPVSNEIPNSYAFKKFDNSHKPDDGDYSNNTVIAHDLTNLEGILYTVTSLNLDPAYPMDNNALIIEPQGTERLKVEWRGPTSSFEAWITGSLAAVGATQADHACNNTLAIRNTDFLLNSEVYVQNILTLTSVGLNNVATLTPEKEANISNNRVILDNVTLKATGSATTQTSGIVSFDAGAFLSDSETRWFLPDTTIFDGNSVFIRKSNLDLGYIAANYLFSNRPEKKRAQFSNGLVWIEDSEVNFDFTKTSAHSYKCSLVLTADQYGTHALQNRVVLKNGTLSYANSFQDKYLIVFTVAGAMAIDYELIGNQVYIEDTDLSFKGAINTTKIFGGSSTTSQYETFAPALLEENSTTIVGKLKTLQIQGDSPLWILGGYLRRPGEARRNGLELANVAVQNPSFLAGTYSTLNYDAKLASSSLTNSYVNLKQSTFTNSVKLFGALIEYSDKFAMDSSNQLEANQNDVRIESSTFEQGIDTLIGAKITANGGTQQATKNTVTIGSNVFSKNKAPLQIGHLAGGLVDGQALQNSFIDNKLSVASPIVVTSKLEGFQKFEFDLSDYKNNGSFISYMGDQPIALCLNKSGDHHTTFTIMGLPTELPTSVKLIESAAGFVDLNLSTGESQPAQAGDHTDLLEDNASIVHYASLARQQRLESMSDVSLSIENVNEQNGQALILGLGDASWSDEANDQTSALMESALSSLGALTAADDLFMDQALRDQVLTQEGPFVAARTGRWSFDTNTRIESNITSAVMGYGHEVGINTHVGLFVEMGLGAYKTRTGLSDGSTSQGSGSQNYAGLGLFAMQKLPIEGLLLNGYVKAGGLQNHFDITMMNQGLAFNRTAAYWGANLGVMFDYPLTPNVATRSYLQYFYDGLGSQTFDKVASDLAITSSFHYDAIHAHRIQLGTQVTYNYQPNLKPFIGIAIEDAIQAKATGTATDSQGILAIKPSDMEGVTALLSAGWKYVREDQGLNVGLSATGYGGARNGVSAQVQATWAF